MMKRKCIAILMVLMLAMSLAACGGGEETTITGMVVSLDGTVLSLVEMDMSKLEGMDFAGGERPEMPEGMEGFQGFEGFKPEDFEGTFPEGEDFPQWGDGEMPEMPQMPEGMEPPEGMTMPEFSGEKGSVRPGMENFTENMETKTLDIANAHISLEINGGKASGSTSDLVPGAFVTVTVNGKGQATYVLVSSQSGFGRSR